MSLHTVARFADLREDRGTRVEIGSLQIVLLRAGERVYAYQGECPHAQAPLDEGVVCNGRLICPWHKAMFTVEDGQVCEPPALSGLTRYPVKVIDGDVQVDDQPLAPNEVAQAPDSRCFVIVGAGAAGTAATAALREQGFAGRLVLIDRESDPGYDRTVLSKYVLAGEMSPQETPPLLDEFFYNKQKIERVKGEVIRLDVAAKRVSLADGRTFDYDAALLASGGEPRPLSVKGTHLHNILMLRSRADAERILQTAKPGARAVIIGGSFIGLESASALRRHGLEVSVVTHHATPFSQLFGERIGLAILSLHEDHGVVFHTATQPKAFEGQDNVEAVLLEDGQRLPADLVLVGIGVSPVTELLEGIELNDDGGLPVNEDMRAAPGLWAAGDIASFALQGVPTRIEHWRLAQQQARIAAQNMLGGETRYADVPFFWTYHFDKTFEMLGHADQWDRIVFEGNPEQYAFIALLCKGEQVEAVVACEYSRQMALLAERMKLPLLREEALQIIRQMVAQEG
ncbi:FAD-dependent oxidoreductase [Pseudomonas sp. 6D_7.1_Bac1]|jgi:NADPH-dependent 2,4-dienoyl-CoA reductase/sulfur reductase-like enzyme/nitrite reductase/ring-hydroxylating ferredoxin subunit|uniref:FAD-dependent oxidoreductase n=1 Tax=Pseudomonas sp. 6D_7.1_Bac1 TaxID=2971615 RepID=UPI0021CA0976|nr:FAD-dependent oxidoreductase [Pseudomonas sp. 6D_7.1_Bac1]MCU1752009.1 FAD-dependent oxidoreductase [Pseudomonas sp. 6D_7.1_Bac1]